jgi:L-galactose dehydrogenase
MPLPQRTFLRWCPPVPRLGLGGGGPSRLGTRAGTPDADDGAVRVVYRAIDLGIRVLDTAETYGTEPHFARAIRDLAPSVRDELVICTKHSPFRADGSSPRTGVEFASAIDMSLRALGVEAIDLEQVHGVEPSEYAYVCDEILPALERARDAGKVRAIGLTEMFQRDPAHTVLADALGEPDSAGPWESVMVGYNILNQTAAEVVFPRASALGVGTLGMFAVRRALSKADRLREVVSEPAVISRIPEDLVLGADGEPLSWLLDEAESITEAAYRFCLSQPGPDVVLTGTGSIEHLEANVRAFERGPLSAGAVDRLRRAFAGIDTVTGQ